MVRDTERRLAALLAAARVGCVVRIAIGGGLLAIAMVYEVWVAKLMVFTSQMFGIALGLPPAAIGLYVIVRALIRWAVLRRLDRRPERVELIELAMRWGRPALRVVFKDGASETFGSGGVDRALLVDAIRRRAAARTLPGARVVS
jgi:hypothetical protein